MRMATEGYKNIGIPENIISEIDALLEKYPDKFQWKSRNDFCTDAVRHLLQVFKEELRKEDLVKKHKDYLDTIEKAEH